MNKIFHLTNNNKNIIKRELMKMSKRSIIITCIILTIIIIGTLIFYIERIHEPKLTEENIVNNTINKVEIVK